MALFKILRGSKDNLINKRVDNTRYVHDGYCYFTPEDGKFYIDVATNPSNSTEEPVIGTNRIAVNANKADQLNVGRNISLTGDASGNANFNGSTDISINTTISQIYRQLTISTASSTETLKLNNNGGSGATGIVMQSSS